ncbi:hypothetical protein SDC9_107111 [bioreactor metagenome]|uniref:Uncharacterized protein n=1 Tax=bioreactor metagenome TaxID=1076179 RepID=A0A645B466_9ZZZZ
MIAVGTPVQLLRRETYQSAMGSYGGQCPAKSETVGQEDVGTLHAEFIAVVLLSQHYIADERFDGRYQRICCIPTRSTDVPAALLDIFLHEFVLHGVIFLHPGILHTSFEVEDIIGILLQQEEVLVDSVPYILFDSSLYVPVPLGVQVGIRHHVDFGSLLGLRGLCL